MLAWEVWEAGSQPVPSRGRRWGARRGFAGGAARRPQSHGPVRCSPGGKSLLAQHGADGQDLSLLPASPCPSPCCPPALSATVPRAGGWRRPAPAGAEPCPARQSRIPRRGRRFADLRLFSQLPRHILPGSHVCFHRRCALGSRPRGLRLGGNSIQMELFFFLLLLLYFFFCTFSWGKGWEKLTGQGKERICERGCSAQPRFCRVTLVVELAGETEARGSPAEPGAGTVPADGTVCSSCPSPCGCQRGGGTIRSHPHQLGAAAGRARAQLLLVQGLEVGGKPPPPCLQP